MHLYLVYQTLKIIFSVVIRHKEEAPLACELECGERYVEYCQAHKTLLWI